MRKLLPFLACLMLLLTGLSGAAHAAEAAGGSLGGIAFAVHADGDGDEVPADGDSAVPHHHSPCHGHDTGQPAAAQAAIAVALDGHCASPRRVAVLDGAPVSVTLRPPQA